jgi:hypothetical protein
MQMDITKFEHKNQEIEVHVNMGDEVFIYNSFPDVDDTTFTSGIAYLDIEALEKCLKIAKKARSKHNQIMKKIRL